MDEDRKRQAALLLARDERALSASEEEELVRLLRSGREARRQLREHAMLGAAIRARLAGRPAALAETPAPRRVRPVFVAAAGIALAAALFAFGKRARDERRQERAIAEALAAEAIARGAMPPPDAPAASGAAPPTRVAPVGTGAPLAARHEVLRALPEEVLSRQRAWDPGAHGLFLANATRWECAGYQAFGMDTLAVGAVLGRADWVGQGFGVIDATFAKQTANGHFGDGPACVSWWIAALDAALGVVERSAFAAAYEARISALAPGLRAAGRYLSGDEAWAKLSPEVDHRAHTAFVGAAALAALGRRLDDSPLRERARALATVGLAFQRPDGAFLHLGGEDVGFHADRLMHLHWLLDTLPDPAFQDAARRAGSWLAAQVPPDGLVDPFGPARRARCVNSAGGGHCAYINWREMRWGLLLHAHRFGAPAALDAVRRLNDGELRDAEERRRSRT